MSACAFRRAGQDAAGLPHGYHPSDPDSFSAIASNQAIPPTVTKIQHIHQLMLDELGLREKVKDA